MAKATNQTSVINAGSTLERKKWLHEGLLEAAPMSQWEGLKGNSKDSVVFVTTDISKDQGHEVEFSFNGEATGKGVENKERLRGNEEQKKIFSDKIRVQRVRHGLDNGDEFDDINIGNLNSGQHTQSRMLLGRWNVRKRDQWLFDASQGFLKSEANTHVIRPNGKATIGDLVAADTAGYDFMMDVEDIIKSGRDFTVGFDRAPLEPITLADGRRMWLWLIDSRVNRDIRKDSNFISITAQGDIRGMDNRIIKGVIGTFGSLIVAEKQNFFGKSASRGLTGTGVEIAGLRQVHEAGLFTGEAGFDGAGVVASRSLILGAGALQVANGKEPDYKIAESDDYGITSGTGMEMFTNTQATVLYADNNDYEDAKRAGYHYGIVAIDTFARVQA